MPLLVITHNLITGEDEIDLQDENITTNKCFDMKGFPIMCTIGEVNFKIQVESQLIVDLSYEECESVDSYYIVCFDEQNNLMGFRKFGQSS